MSITIRKAAAALTAAALLMSTGCNGSASQEPSQPEEPKTAMEVDLTPEYTEGTITPPFWVVEDKETGAQVFLLGSMHVGTQDVVYPDYVMNAYENSNYISPEVDSFRQNLEGEEYSNALDYFTLKEGTAADYITDHDATVEFMKKHEMYNPNLEDMIPFYWMSMLSSKVLVDAELYGTFGTENKLLSQAYEEKKEVREVEGYKAQYEMMSSIPMNIQAELLAECIGDENYQTQVDTTRELFEAWSTFDKEYLENLKVYDPETVDDPEGWQKYYDLMYADRQKGMADFVVNALENGDLCFFFVGTMHFYAEPTVIDLIEDAGYTVSEIRQQKPESEAPAA